MDTTHGTTTPAAPAHAATPVAHDDSEKGLAAVAYILTWFTGLIIFFVAKKEQRYARWNALQAIGLGVALVVIGIVLSIFNSILALGGGGRDPGMFGAAFGLMSLFWLLALAVIIITAVKAYQGRPLRLPIIADIADKNA